MGNPEYALIGRWTIADGRPLLGRLEQTADIVWLSRTVRCSRHTLRGIPARRVDVLLQDGLVTDQPVIVEIGRKAGRYDGTIRDRIAIRQPDRGPTSLHWRHLEPYPDAVLVLCIDEVDGSLAISLATGGDGWRGPGWTATYQVLRFCPTDPGDLRRIVSWHWTRYFSHLLWEDVETIAEVFSIEAPQDGETLAEVNRRASRALYRLSRDLGWRKLTQREQRRLGLDGAQWQRQETILSLMQEKMGGHPTGTGEYTRRSAAGRSLGKGS